jgi:endonuclease YncB( thermonuclease family)
MPANDTPQRRFAERNTCMGSSVGRIARSVGLGMVISVAAVASSLLATLGSSQPVAAQQDGTAFERIDGVAPADYQVVSEELQLDGRPRVVVRIVVAEAPPTETAAAFAAPILAVLARYPEAQAVRVFAYSAGDDTGGPSTRGTAEGTRDGLGWTGDGVLSDPFGGAADELGTAFVIVESAIDDAAGALRFALPQDVKLVAAPVDSVETALAAWAASQATDCSGYDSQIWAQSAFASEPSRFSGLDPDGNGIACEELGPGAAPAWWTTEIPAGGEPAEIVSVTDGDTIQVTIGGVEEAMGLILIDAPETNDPNTPPECFGQEATAYLEWLLSLGGELSLESDVSGRDEFGRLLRYAWLDLVGGEVYLVNEVMARSGFAAESTFFLDVKYEEEIREAARFAREHGYGLWSDCITDEDGDTNELAAA